MRSALEISIVQFESKSALREGIAKSSSPHIMLGERDEAPREFFCFTVGEHRAKHMNIGLLSAGVGIKPSVLPLGDRVFIGFNKRIAAIALESCEQQAEIELRTLFWEFIDSSIADHIYVRCETAIIAISTDCSELWRVDTPDVIVNCKIKEAILRLELMDAPAIEIDLLTGRAN